MKTIAKFGLIGLALAASSAHADVFLPSSGNGELTLFVRNDTTNAVYARGLQIRLDQVLTQAQINAGYTGDVSIGLVQQLDYALATLGPDAALSTFLGTGGSYTWTIMAGDNVGSNLASNAYRYLTTTTTTYNEDNPAGISNSDLGTTFNNLQQTLSTLNDNIDSTGGTLGDGHSTAANGQWRQTGAVPGEIMGNWGGAGPDTATAVGTAAHLYLLTSNHVGSGSGNGGLARTYQGFDVILNSNGTLSAITPPAVPLPAAVWMLASGLVTLAGVGRRKGASATTVAA